MMKYKVPFLLLLLPFCSVAQNLVPNPSFEEYEECPQWLDNFYAENWISPTWGSPDLFNVCSEEQLGTPQNVVGWQNPKTGNSYAGIWLSDFMESQYREYVQCQLLSPLEAQEQYEISFYISRADSSTKACSNMGLYLSEAPVESDNNHHLPLIPQVINNSSIMVTDAFTWTHIIDTITAIGGESYITIGVFTDNNNTNWTTVDGGWMSEAYYYIDDVSVMKTTPISVDKLGQVSKNYISIYPNPSKEVTEVLSSEIVKEYSVFTSSGKLIYRSFINRERFFIDVSRYEAGTYYLSINTNNHCSVHKLFVY